LPPENVKYIITMKRILLIIILSIFILIIATFNAFAQNDENRWRGIKYHYGTYCPALQQECYGERKAVRTKTEAREELMKYFSSGRETIGEIKDRGLFFEVEIKGRDNRTVDRIIIDKRTGRIRSVY
jgi:hypothetical protein